MGHEARGTNLLQTTAVRFQAYNALRSAPSFWPESSSVLDVTVPEAARTGPITIETPSGSVTTAIPFVVRAPVGGKSGPLVVSSYDSDFTSTQVLHLPPVAILRDRGPARRT